MANPTSKQDQSPENNLKDTESSATPQVKRSQSDPANRPPPNRPTEVGGPKGPEPTRYGDWERNGRCTDF